MFEREIRDASFVFRWSITRTLRKQSIADHSYYVTMYANDLCIFLDVPETMHLSVLQKCLWHDLRDEIFTSDIPGPAKRSLNPDRTKLEAQTEDWKHQVFGQTAHRDGSGLDPISFNQARAILKTADTMDAHFEMCTEVQMGNGNCTVRVEKTRVEMLAWVDALCEAFQLPDIRAARLKTLISNAGLQCLTAHSQSCEVIYNGREY